MIHKCTRLLALTIGVFVTWYMVWVLEFSNVKTVRIQSLQDLTIQSPSWDELRSIYLRSVAEDVEKFRDKSWTSFRLEEVEDSILKYPFVSSAVVKRQLAGSLSVQIIFKTPLAWYRNKKNILLVDRTGTSWKLDHESQITESLAELIDIKENWKIVHWLSLLPQEGGMSLLNISKIKYQKNSGYIAQLQVPTILVKLGQEPNISKIKRLDKVLRYISERSIPGLELDASFSKKVLVRVNHKI